MNYLPLPWGKENVLLEPLLKYVIAWLPKGLECELVFPLLLTVCRLISLRGPQVYSLWLFMRVLSWGIKEWKKDIWAGVTPSSTMALTGRNLPLVIQMLRGSLSLVATSFVLTLGYFLTRVWVGCVLVCPHNNRNLCITFCFYEICKPTQLGLIAHLVQSLAVVRHTRKLHI